MLNFIGVHSMGVMASSPTWDKYCTINKSCIFYLVKFKKKSYKMCFMLSMLLINWEELEQVTYLMLNHQEFLQILHNGDKR